MTDIHSSNRSREVVHLLGDQPANDTGTTQNEMELTCQRPLEPSEDVPEGMPSPGESNIRYTAVAGNDPSEVSSALASPFSTFTTEKNHEPELTEQRTVLPPLSLRTLPLLGFVSFLIILVVVLEVLYFVSNKHQGLMTSGKNAYYLWKYCPTASKSEADAARSTT